MKALLLAGCNYVEVFPPDRSSGSGASNAGSSAVTSGITAGGGAPCYGAAGAEECGTEADFHCESTENCPDDTSCFCEPGSPDDPLDCVTTADFHCEQLDGAQGCTCFEGSPMSADDCAVGQSFHCELPSPPTACDCLDPEA